MATSSRLRYSIIISRKRVLELVVVALLAFLIFEPFFLFHSFPSTHLQSPTPRNSVPSSDRDASPYYGDENQREDTSSNAGDQLGCLTRACLNTTATKLARAFLNRTDQAWCLQTKKSQDAAGLWRGIVLVKVPKAASSTSAAVAIRIGKRASCQAVQWRHHPAITYVNRSTDRTFFFTTVRDPAARAISTVFFHVVSRDPNRTSTDDFLIQHLKWNSHPHSGAVSKGQGGFQLQYTSLLEIPPYSAWNASQPGRVVRPQRVVETVRQIVENYDFIIVVERADESLVAMALLLGIDVGDVLVTSSKVAGSRYHFAHFPGNVFKCIPTVKSFVSPGVETFLKSNWWRAANYGDYLLHHAANLSLDRTIEQIGRERFNSALEKYHRLRALEEEKCAPHVKFPCSNQGLPQPQLSKESCYLPYYDFGCGYKCIDRIVESANGVSS